LEPVTKSLEVYTMVSVSDQAAAVESLPPLPGIPHVPAIERPRLRIAG
jgi:hypothetical protein